MPQDPRPVFSLVDSVTLMNTMVPIRTHPENETIAKTIAIFQYASNKVRLKTINRNKGIKMIKCFLLSNSSIFNTFVIVFPEIIFFRIRIDKIDLNCVVDGADINKASVYESFLISLICSVLPTLRAKERKILG